MENNFLRFAEEFAAKAGGKTEADINALKVYTSLGYSKEEANAAFNSVFKERSTPARVNKGVIEVSKEHFKLKPHQKDFLADHEILHFEYHRKRKNLRRKLTGKKVQEFINYLTDCESKRIKDYVEFLKRDFKFKLWWYNLFRK